MTDLGRNAPCPCGSGRKYKVCCLNRDLQQRGAQRVRDLKRQRISELHANATRRVLNGLMALGHDPATMVLPELRAEDPGFLLPWVAFRHGPDRTWLEIFLATAPKLPADERTYLEAERRAWLGIFEVLTVTPGEGIRVRDRLTNVERDVWEVSGSHQLTPRLHLVGWLTELPEGTILGSVYPQPFPPRFAESLVQDTRALLSEVAGLPPRRALKPEELATPACALAIYRCARMTDLIMKNQPPPTLHNTDGEPIMKATATYTLTADSFEAVQQALIALPGVEVLGRTAALVELQFSRPGNAQISTWDTTVVGRAELTPSELMLAANSENRILHLCRTVEATTPHLTLKNRQIEPFRLPDAPGPASPVREVPPPEIQAVVRQMLEKHYASWVDEPIPALNHETPRQAATTKAGRTRLEKLLREMEYHEGRKAEWERFDLAGLRQKLGL